MARVLGSFLFRLSAVIFSVKHTHKYTTHTHTLYTCTRSTDRIEQIFEWNWSHRASYKFFVWKFTHQKQSRRANRPKNKRVNEYNEKKKKNRNNKPRRRRALAPKNNNHARIINKIDWRQSSCFQMHTRAEAGGATVRQIHNNAIVEYVVACNALYCALYITTLRIHTHKQRNEREAIIKIDDV